MSAQRPALPTRRLAAALLLGMLSGCATRPPIQAVDHVDLDRFMGDWYVIASIPTWPERDAVNAIESYRIGADGRIHTVFRFRRGDVDAPLKTMQPVAVVRPDTGNAVWGMQFVWPIKAEYVIAGLAPDYSDTIIARSKRDYVWIMARTPTLPRERYDALVAQVAALGYDLAELREVPQQWPEAQPRPPLP